MTHRNAKLVGSTFLVLLAAVGGTVMSSRASADDKAAAPAAQVAIGAPAPLFELKDQDGKVVRLDDLKDKVVVLEWFNNECPFVQKHYKTGAMNKTAKKYTDKGVVWLSINSTKSHDVAHNKQVAGEWKIEHPILDDSTGTVGHLYGAKTTPEMYVIDHGNLAYMGAIDSKATPDTADLDSATNYVAAALDELLAGKPVTTAQTKSYGCSVKYKD